MAIRKAYSIACIPGDGIGLEIIDQAIKVLNSLAALHGVVTFNCATLDWSSETYQATGKYMPDDWRQQLQKHDAILFGAVGWPTVPDHISLWGMILPIRTALGQYVNIRPTRILKGTRSPLERCGVHPEDLDWVIVRENSEGEYAGQGGTTHHGTQLETATEVSIFTRVGVERIMRFAFEVAKSRPRRKLTMVTKSNAQRHGMVLWDTIFHEVALEYKGQVECDKMLVDAMTVRMVNKPQSLDTIVATNRECITPFQTGFKATTRDRTLIPTAVHADILSDLAAALAGSIGTAPSSSLDPTRRHPSLFEPIHGSAPDIAGKGVANPVGTLWSAAEMVRWLGNGDMDWLADKLMVAVEKVLEKGVKTADMGGQASTGDVADAVCEELTLMYRS